MPKHMINDVPDKHNFEHHKHIANNMVYYLHTKKMNSKTAIIWIQGYNNYFFHYHLTQYLDADIYAVDLYRCAYARQLGEFPNAISDIATYYPQIDDLYRKYIADKYEQVIFCGQSTGGLVILSYLYNYNNNVPADWKLNRCKIADKIILISPLLKLYNDSVSLFIANYIVYYLAYVIDWLNASPFVCQTNNSKLEFLNYFDVNRMYCTDIAGGITFGWVHTVINYTAVIQSGKIKFDIPILLMRSDKTVNTNVVKCVNSKVVLVNKDMRGDSVLNIADMQQYGPALSNQYFEAVINNAYHDIFTSVSKKVRKAATNVFIKFMNYK